MPLSLMAPPSGGGRVMTPQRRRLTELKRSIREAVADGLPTEFVVRLRNLLTREEQTLLASREPGSSQTIADIQAATDEETE